MAAVLSVSELALAISEKVRGMRVQVRGEISNLSQSGHKYFTLKDSKSVLQAVVWRSTTIDIALENGIEVICEGYVSIYSGRSQYQLTVSAVQYDGVGALLQIFEKRKQKLLAEGLFDRKRPIPLIPGAIGVVTSLNGAAVEDIINRISNRFPCKVIIRNAIVQGKGAALSVIRAINDFNALRNVSVIIVARGGGSVEDLWAFNEEELVRCVAASAIPIISGIGHETDFTLTDYAADMRAPTPSAAAELATPSLPAVFEKFDTLLLRMRSCIQSRQPQLSVAAARLSCYSARCAQLAINIRNIRHRMHSALLNRRKVPARLPIPNTERFEAKLDKAIGILESCSIKKILNRGFCIARKEGRILRSIQDVCAGTTLELQLDDGRVVTKVNEILL